MYLKFVMVNSILSAEFRRGDDCTGMRLDALNRWLTPSVPFVRWRRFDFLHLKRTGENRRPFVCTSGIHKHVSVWQVSHFLLLRCSQKMWKTNISCEWKCTNSLFDDLRWKMFVYVSSRILLKWEQNIFLLREFQVGTNSWQVWW